MRPPASRPIWKQPVDRVFAVALLLLMLPAHLAADSIYLRNGQIFQGLILEAEPEGLKIQLPDGNIMQFQTKDVWRMQYDLGGLRMCYTLQQKPERICTSLLRQWRKDAIVIARAPDYKREETVPIQDLLEMEIWVKESQNMLHYLADVEARGEIELRDRNIVKGKIRQDGTILHISRFFSSDRAAATSVARIAIELERRASAPEPAAVATNPVPATTPAAVATNPVPATTPAAVATHPVPATTPAAAATNPAPAGSRKIGITDFYPGVARWRDNSSPMGIIMMSLFTASSAASLSYWGAAARESSAASRDSTTLLFNNRDYLKRYQVRYRSMSASGFFALGVLLVNTADVLWIRDRGATSSVHVQFSVDPPPGPGAGTASPYAGGRGESIVGASLSFSY